jgi:hypothetical protein
VAKPYDAFEVTIVHAVYEDRTAVGDEVEIAHTFRNRQRQLANYQGWLERLNRISSNSVSVNDVNALLEDVNAHQDNAAYQMFSVTAKAGLQLIQSGLTTAADWLRASKQMTEAGVQVFTLHSERQR